MTRYIGIGDNAGQVEGADDALEYAAARCGIQSIDPDAPEAEEFCRMLEEWYYSGDWVVEGLDDASGL